MKNQIIVHINDLQSAEDAYKENMSFEEFKEAYFEILKKEMEYTDEEIAEEDEEDIQQLYHLMKSIIIWESLDEDETKEISEETKETISHHFIMGTKLFISYLSFDRSNEIILSTLENFDSLIDTGI